MISKNFSCLLSKLNTNAFLFNSYRGKDFSQFSVPFKELVDILPLIKLNHCNLYRSRKIDINKDVDCGKGIFMRDGILDGGFDEENSRIPRKEYCDIQRLNRKHEQVFYIAEEEYTSISEQKVSENDYLSVANFLLISPVSIIDFSANDTCELKAIISDDIEEDFYQKTMYSARELYSGVQKFLTILDSSEEFYNVSNSICDILKADSRIDGIRYLSYYNGHNIGIWNYRPKDYLFKGSKIIKL